MMYIKRKNRVRRLFLVGILALCSCWASGCLGGKAPSVSNSCRVYKLCQCQDVSGRDRSRCENAIDATLDAHPSDRSRDDYCRDLYEQGRCYADLPGVKGGRVSFRGGAVVPLPQRGPGWVRGACAQAFACCLQLRTSTDRDNCQTVFGGLSSEQSCEEKASEWGFSLDSCDPSQPASSGKTPPTPRPEPSTEPIPDGGSGE